MVAAGIFLFAGLNGNRQAILAGRQRACSELSESTWWIVGLVEVYDCSAARRHRTIEIASRSIGLGAGCLVGEHNKKLVGTLLYDGIKLVSRASHVEADGSW